MIKLIRFVPGLQEIQAVAAVCGTSSTAPPRPGWRQVRHSWARERPLGFGEPPPKTDFEGKNCNVQMFKHLVSKQLTIQNLDHP